MSLALRPFEAPWGGSYAKRLRLNATGWGKNIIPTALPSCSIVLLSNKGCHRRLEADCARWEILS
jgi:hypothetical protein